VAAIASDFSSGLPQGRQAQVAAIASDFSSGLPQGRQAQVAAIASDFSSGTLQGCNWWRRWPQHLLLPLWEQRMCNRQRQQSESSKSEVSK